MSLGIAKSIQVLEEKKALEFENEKLRKLLKEFVCNVNYYSDDLARGWHTLAKQTSEVLGDDE